MPKLVTRPQSQVPPVQDRRRERLAVNVADLTRLDPTVCGLLFGGKLDNEPIRTDPDRLDEAAVQLTCDLLQAACIVDVVRGRDRTAGEYPTRVYLRRGAAWVKLPPAAVLTCLVGDAPALDPGLFPPEVTPADLVPPPGSGAVTL